MASAERALRAAGRLTDAPPDAPAAPPETWRSIADRNTAAAAPRRVAPPIRPVPLPPGHLHEIDPARLNDEQRWWYAVRLIQHEQGITDDAEQLSLNRR